MSSSDANYVKKTRLGVGRVGGEGVSCKLQERQTRMLTYFY